MILQESVPCLKTTFANPASAKLIGYQPEELIGKLLHAILHHTRSDGTSYPKEECSIYASFKTGTSHHVDDEIFWKKDGSREKLNMLGIVAGSVGNELRNPLGVMNISHEVSR